MTAPRNRFTQDDLREIRIIKLENQKFNPKTDTVKNFLVKLRTEANKAYPAPKIVVVEAKRGDAEARRFERETTTRKSALEMSENRKNEQIKRFFINGELERRALIDTVAFANVISREFYKELIKTNINLITEIEKPDLDKVKMANGNIVKIDKAINVTFNLGTQTFTEDFLLLIVTIPVILGNPFFVKHKVSICPGRSYIKFPAQTLQINEIKPEKQPRRVV